MCVIFLVIVLIVGVWIFISPWILGYADAVVLVLSMLFGLVIIIFSSISLRLNKFLFTSPSYNITSKPSAWQTGTNAVSVDTVDIGKKAVIAGKVRWVLVIMGILSIALGITFNAASVGWSLIWSGIVITLFSGILTQISVQPVSFNLVGHDGSILLATLGINWKDGSIVIKGKIMGSLTTNAYLKAGEMWKALSLIPPIVIMSLPLFLYKGWRAGKVKSEK